MYTKTHFLEARFWDLFFGALFEFFCDFGLHLGTRVEHFGTTGRLFWHRDFEVRF